MDGCHFKDEWTCPQWPLPLHFQTQFLELRNRFKQNWDFTLFQVVKEEEKKKLEERKKKENVLSISWIWSEILFSYFPISYYMGGSYPEGRTASSLKNSSSHSITAITSPMLPMTYWQNW